VVVGKKRRSFIGRKGHSDRQSPQERDGDHWCRRKKNIANKKERGGGRSHQHFDKLGDLLYHPEFAPISVGKKEITFPSKHSVGERRKQDGLTSGRKENGFSFLTGGKRWRDQSLFRKSIASEKDRDRSTSPSKWGGEKGRRFLQYNIRSKRRPAAGQFRLKRLSVRRGNGC